MTPVTFNNTLGWLHAPRGGVGRVAVLICPGMMQDALLSHCSLRVLGDRLAEAGYWALRFDYPGTADSQAEGDVEPPEGHWRSWQNSIDTAADWLRETTGASELVFCGVRIGATLATLVASRRTDVAAVVQMAPVVRGNSYVRQLLVQAQLQTGRPLPADEDLVFYEFRLGPRTLSEMRAVDLRQVTPRSGQKLVLYPRADSRLIEECTQAWTAAGASVTRGTWTKLEPMLRHNIIEENTLADVSDVVAWLSKAVPYDATHKAVTPPATPLALQPAGDCVESPMLFGRRGRLFGILCRPAHGQPDTAVIITNAGRDPHYGSCRQSVTLARQLARAGIASLRMDFAGLGDSLGPTGRENFLTPMFEADRVPDIKGAIDSLERLGYRRFALQGLCAGAYHSLQGGLHDPRVSTLLLVNIPLFSLPGEVMEFLTHRSSSFVHYLKRLASFDGLKRLFTGQVNVLRILRGQVDQVRMRTSETVQGLASKVGVADRRTPARRAMADLSTRGVRTLFLFSAGQGEIDAFAREFGQVGEGLAGYPGAEMQVIEHMDHDMSQAPGRAVGQGLMVKFMSARS